MFKIQVFTFALAILLMAKADLFAQYPQAGDLDTTFNVGLGCDNTVRSIAVLPNGKALIVGDFTSFNGVTKNYIARLHSDGSLDNSFNSFVANVIYTLTVQSDGKILIGGAFQYYGTTPINSIARLHPNGNLDSSFNPGWGLNGSVFSIAVQSDWKILVGGAFTNFNNIPRGSIARLNINGTLDTSFNPGTGVNGVVYTLSLQQDDKMVIVGNFASYNSVPRNHIARVNANGSLDSTFNQGTGANYTINTLHVQSDGKFLIGGAFTNYNGTSINRVARINNNGSLDSSFNPGFGAFNNVLAISQQSDGKILIGGAFTYFNTNQNYLTCLNSDGSHHSSFNLGTGPNNFIFSIAAQPDGKALIGGWFTSYKGIQVNRITRIWTNSGILSTTSAKAPNQTINLYPNPVKDRITIETTEPFQYEWYSITGKRLHSANINEARAELETHDLVPGTYLLKIVTSKGVETRRIVKE